MKRTCTICNGTGQADSGAPDPQGNFIQIECECQYLKTKVREAIENALQNGVCFDSCDEWAVDLHRYCSDFEKYDVEEIFWVVQDVLPKMFKEQQEKLAVLNSVTGYFLLYTDLQVRSPFVPKSDTNPLVWRCQMAAPGIFIATADTPLEAVVAAKELRDKLTTKPETNQNVKHPWEKNNE